MREYRAVRYVYTYITMTRTSSTTESQGESLQTPVVEIRPFRELDLSGGVVIEAFPSVGLVSAIVGTYIIRSLNLDQIAVIDRKFIKSRTDVARVVTDRPRVFHR